ncbi:dTDP-4-amino-4,6-dideoxygalactose transaminase [Clostridium cavendishii DSM 21758]|uniref:dTDP-4-amino-4,6-dideoxygalactose transaminase n=1 Tax=Clostridium cavendishii DSM 21758 TaxID=1121302 RepID=A0A1M6Q774_9CLOT|nr:DegT/DnrJ/EryC1/StrS aminotransferase family protein [Clostridium cavendishii]SHK15986.1 dTDP-4-amino-4,6-dideoxygalactose transaminase [Clostridium cavendishii DSM 21758]
MSNRQIQFSPPDITEKEIDLVVEVLKSGWITSGPKVRDFEEGLANYCNTERAVALNSATAAMELILKVFDIKEGDEVITTPYTYSATSVVLVHRGIKPVYVDLKPDSFFMNYDKIGDAITEKTKAIMPVDFGGYPCDYDKIKAVLKEKNREDIIILCDSAHSFGAKYKGEIVGSQCDFHSFSFHAVKNLTTAEGGAITYNNKPEFDKEDLYSEFKVTSLQGQTKDAFSKMKAGAWEYDIVTDGFKCNMTDLCAAIGIAQLSRYSEILDYRREIFEAYTNELVNEEWAIIPEVRDDLGTESSYHLYALRIKGFGEAERGELITRLAREDIATNVHFKPLPMFTLYKNLGYDIKDYPNAYNQYKNQISLPVHTKITRDDAKYLIDRLKYHVNEIRKNTK